MERSHLKKYQELKPEFWKILHGLHVDGEKTLRQLEADTGICYTLIRARWDSMGLPRCGRKGSGGSRKLTQERAEQAFAMLVSGDYSRGFVAKHFGVRTETMALRFKELGFDLGAIPGHSFDKALNDEVVSEIYRRYLNGEEVRDLAKEYGVAHAAIYHRFDRRGFPPRSGTRRRDYKGAVLGRSKHGLWLLQRRKEWLESKGVQ